MKTATLKCEAITKASRIPQTGFWKGEISDVIIKAFLTYALIDVFETTEPY